jgi:UDP-2,3-diacylglucosamine pyrophosphatase LpxH
MDILHTPVWKYIAAVFLLLTGIILTFMSLLYLILFQFNSSLTWISFLPYAILLIFTLFGLLYLFAARRFFHVPPSASFAFPWDCGPWLHIHGNPETSITINWVTAIPCPTNVEYWKKGTSPDKKTVIDGVSGKMHRISLNSLESNTEYEYCLLNFAHNPGPHSFRTAESPKSSLSFVVIGDTQNGGGDQIEGWGLLPLVENISSKSPDLLVSVGDFCDQGNDLKSWKVTFQALEKLSDRIPFHVAVGNHDTGTNYLQDKSIKKYPDDGANFDYFFGYQYETPPEEDQITSFRGRYYSLEYSNVLFLFIDTQNSTMAEPLNPQWDWICNKLKIVDKSKWTIMIFHRDLVDIKKQQDGTYTYKYDKFAQYLLPIFAEYKVDLIIQGHNHIFQLMNYMENQISLCLITSGGAGNEFRRNSPLTNEKVKLSGYVLQEDSTHYLWVELDETVARIEARYSDDSVLHKFEVQKI